MFHKIRNRRFGFVIAGVLLGLFMASCASTGPKISRADKKRAEEEFNRKFVRASEKWLPKVYRVGYRLVRSPVPGHGDEAPKFGFVGVGVDELKDYAREVYGIDKSIKGVLVRGLYPGSRAEGIDVRPGDVLLKLDGKKTKKLGSFFKIVREAKGPALQAEIWRRGEKLTRRIPAEKVYYNAQFFLAATPHLEATASFSKINVGIGAIRYCRNDDELAVLMGHELAHVSLKHSMKHLGIGVSSAVAYGLVAGIVNAFTFPGVGTALLYPVEKAQEALISRRYEREADYHGILHAFHSGYHVENGAKVFARLATETPGFSLLAYTFASHPKWSERALRLEKMIEELKARSAWKIEQGKSPDWEVVIPMEGPETIHEVLDELLKEAPLPTTSEKDTAIPASPDKAPASEYPVPKRS